MNEESQPADGQVNEPHADVSPQPDDVRLPPPIDREQMAAHAALLGGDVSALHVFQVIPEGKAKRSQSAETLIGTFDEVYPRLFAANMRGCAITVTVNQTDGKGRKAGNIVRIRALFIDCDGGRRPTEWHLPPSAIIQSVNGTHAYWLVVDCPLDEFTGAQKRLASHYGGDPAVSDVPRVMRLAGSRHCKGDPVLVQLESALGHQYTLAQILEGLPPLPAPKERVRPMQASTGARRRPPAADHVAAASESLDLVALFSERGLYRRPLGDPGKHAVVCPWAAEHTDPDMDPDSDSSATVVWEATDESPATFHCSHAHCHSRTLKDVLRAFGVAPAGPRIDLQALDRRYVFIEQLLRVWDRETRTLLTLDAFKMRGPAERLWASGAHDGRRPTKYGLVFEPNPDKVPSNMFNVYDPHVIMRPTATSMDQVRGDPRLELLVRLVNNIAQGDRAGATYILMWVAWALRNPGRKCVGLVLRGIPGAGKGLLSRILRKIFGRYAAEIGHRQLESRFNGWLGECVLALANEVSAASFRDKVAGESTLKALVTDETIQLERKGQDTYETVNYTKFIFMSNDRVPLIIDPQDRRYSVISSSWALTARDPELLERLPDAIDDDGFIHLVADYLHGLDLSDFNPRIPLVNDARTAVIVEGLTGTARWWHEQCPPPGTYPTNVLYSRYSEWCDAEGEKRMPNSTLTRDAPEEFRRTTVRRSTLFANLGRHVLGTSVNVKCIEVLDKGQGGSQVQYLAGLGMNVHRLYPEAVQSPATPPDAAGVVESDRSSAVGEI